MEWFQIEKSMKATEKSQTKLNTKQETKRFRVFAFFRFFCIFLLDFSFFRIRRGRNTTTENKLKRGMVCLQLSGGSVWFGLLNASVWKHLCTPAADTNIYPTIRVSESIWGKTANGLCCGNTEITAAALSAKQVKWFMRQLCGRRQHRERGKVDWKNLRSGGK